MMAFFTLPAPNAIHHFNSIFAAVPPSVTSLDTSRFFMEIKWTTRERPWNSHRNLSNKAPNGVGEFEFIQRKISEW
jgi:hypothetical protein